MSAIKRPERRIWASVPEDFNIKAGWVTDFHDHEHRVTWEEEDDQEAEWRPAFEWRPFLSRASAVVGIVTIGVFLTLLGLALSEGLYAYIKACPVP